MDTVLLQKQIRDNAEDLQKYLRDLKSWESEMKRKEAEISTTASGSQAYPPVRSKIKKVSKGEKNRSGNKTEEQKKPSKISGSDYESWDKFDVDKACEEFDKEVKKESDEESWGDVEEERRRQEAIYEKERGNDFVKKQKWKDAIQCYNRAIRCYPYDAIFYANRALCYLKTQDLKSAEADSTAALQLDPNYVKAYQRRATARAGLGQFLEARADLLKVMEIEPKNVASKAELTKIEKKIDIKSGKKDTSKQSKIADTKKTDETTSLRKKADIQSAEKESTVKETDEVSMSKRADFHKIEKDSTNTECAAAVGDITEENTASSSSSDTRKITETDMEKQTKCSINQGIMENKSEETGLKIKEKHNIGSSDGTLKFVDAIQKPPHLRSKKPLKRIMITEVDDISMNEGKTSDLSVSDVPQVSKPESKTETEAYSKKHQKESSQQTKEELKKELTSVNTVKTLEQNIVAKPQNVIIEDFTNSIPPVPKTSVQFYVEWKKVKYNPQLGYLFLKQIPGEEFPKLFGDSLESSTLSEIISIIGTHFLQDKLHVLPYIVGLTKVRRFGTLVMFLSKGEKAGIQKILQYCKENEECSEEEYEDLMKIYEL